MWIAELDTRHFEFLACGKTKAQAGVVITRLWEKHCDQYKLAPYGPLYKDPNSLRSCTEFFELRIGDGLRDRQRILEEGHKKAPTSRGYKRSGGVN